MENVDQAGPINSPDPKEPTDAEESYSPNNPPWNSIVAFVLCGISVLLILFFPIVFLTPYLISQGINFSDQEQVVSFIQSDTTSIVLQLSAIIPAHLVTLLLAWLIVTSYREFSFTEMLGWQWGGFRWWHAALLLFGVFAVAVAANSVFGQQDNELLKILRSSRAAVFLIAIIATFSAPIVEEVVYRGVLYSALQRTFNVPIAVIMVTAVFALVHFPQYWGDVATLFTITALSLTITFIRVKTDNLLPCILFHFLVNGIQSVLLILRPYLPESMDLAQPAEAVFFFLL